MGWDAAYTYQASRNTFFNDLSRILKQTNNNNYNYLLNNNLPGSSWGVKIWFMGKG